MDVCLLLLLLLLTGLYIILRISLFGCTSRTVSYARELISVSMCYSQGDGLDTSLSRFMYSTHVSLRVCIREREYKRLCCVWLSSVVRSCATRDDSNKYNVCTPAIPAGIYRPPPSRPSRIYPECRAYETRLALKDSLSEQGPCEKVSFA